MECCYGENNLEANYIDLLFYQFCKIFTYLSPTQYLRTIELAYFTFQAEHKLFQTCKNKWE